MEDLLQQSLQLVARQNELTRAVAVFCASVGLYVLGALWLLALLWHRARLTRAIVVRILVLLVLSYALAKVGNHVISDPRPFLVDGVPPLTSVSQDDGFPSDHVLLAASLTASLWWLDRRLLGPFALATLLVMLGRLGVGAHHTLDVVGSVGIVLVAALVAGWLPLLAYLNQPLLARQRRPDVAH